MDVPGILALSIPIVAIVTGGVVTIARMMIKHRERMALIEMGMHPDFPVLEGDEPAEHDVSAAVTSPAAPSTSPLQ